MNPMAVNAILAIVAALVTIGTINRMNGVTDNAIRISVLMIFAGLLAQGLGIFWKQWDHYADTMLYAGIASLLVTSRRIPCGIPKKYIHKTVFGTTAVIIIYVAWGMA